VLGNGQQDLILAPGDGGPAQVEVLNGPTLVYQGAVAAVGSPVALFTPAALATGGSGLRVAAVPSGIGDQVNVAAATGRRLPGRVEVYPGAAFTAGTTTEPAGGQVLTPFGTGALADGVFVG
jgi:hypothetical protein